MEKIFFDDETFIWKMKLNRVEDKQTFLKDAYSIIDSLPDVKTDGFAHKKEWNNDLDFVGQVNITSKIDELVQTGIDLCKKLYEEKNIEYNKINTDSWVNVVRSKNPVQSNFYNVKEKYHVHTEINKRTHSFVPLYTYVYYIQMPDVMDGEDGVLYFRGKNDNEYWVRPEEDEIIIMPADMPHSPNTAPKSTVDRIVLAGNVGFQYIKKEKSFI